MGLGSTAPQHNTVRTGVIPQACCLPVLIKSNSDEGAAIVIASDMQDAATMGIMPMKIAHWTVRICFRVHSSGIPIIYPPPLKTPRSRGMFPEFSGIWLPGTGGQAAGSPPPAHHTLGMWSGYVRHDWWDFSAGALITPGIGQ